MMKITLNISDRLYQRLSDYAIEAGTLPERAAVEIIEDALATDLERDEEGVTMDYLDQIITAAQAEREYGFKPGRIRNYIRQHPDMVDSKKFWKADGRTWVMERRMIYDIWGDEIVSLDV